jgi:hypothetical protein
MWIYFGVLFLLFGIAVIDSSASNVKVRVFILSLVGIFFCFGYMTGSDWRQYELHYYDDDWVGREVGFTVLKNIMRFLHVGFWGFAIGTKVFIYYSVCRIIKSCAKEAFYLSLTLFLILEGLAVLIDFPMRNAVAMAVSLYCFKYYEERKIFKYMIFALLATLFHNSALILLPLYFVRLENVKRQYLLIAFLLYNIVLSYSNASNLDGYFLILNGSDLQWYYDSYLSQADEALGNGISASFIIHTIFFLLVLTYKDKILQFKYGRALFLCGILYPFLYRLALVIWIFGRFKYFVCVLYFCVVSKIIISSKYRQILIIVVYLNLLISTYRTITANSKYIPYTNYLLEFYNDYSYSYRSNYNYIHSPYKNKQ